MRCCSNFNHDKLKKKAVEGEVDVSTLLRVLIHWSDHLTPGQDEAHFRVNFNRLDVFVRNSVGAVLSPLLLAAYSTGIACGSGSLSTV
jgi:hypothetical protein